MKWPTLLILASLSFQPLILGVGAQEGFYVSLEQSINISNSGLVTILSNFNFINTGDEPLDPWPFEVGLPGEYAGKVGFFRAQGSVDAAVEMRRDGDLTKFFITPEGSSSVPKGGNFTIGLVTMSNLLLEPVRATSYRMRLPIIPESSIHLQRVDVRVRVPNAITLITMLQDAREVSDILGRTWELTFAAPEHGRVDFRDVELRLSGPTDNTVLDFPASKKVIVTSPTGEVKVRETLTVRNIGMGTLREISFLPQGQPTSYVTVLPTQDPPLSNPFRLDLIRGKIDLAKLMGAEGFSLDRGEQLTMTVEYPLHDRFLKWENGSLTITMPLTPSVDGIVRESEATLSIPRGYSLLSGQTLSRAYNTTFFSPTVLKVSVRPGLAAPSLEIAPVATVTFAIVLIGTLLAQRRRREGLEAGMSASADLVSLYNDKVASIQEIMLDLQKSGEKVTRRDVDEARRSLEEARRTMARIGEAEKALLSSRPQLRGTLQDLGRLDREIERGMREFMEIHERAAARRVGREPFLRMVADSTKRLNRLFSRLAALLTSLE